jgi:integrase
VNKRGDGWYKRKRPGGGSYPEWRRRYTNEFGKKDEFVGYTDKALSRTAFNRELDRVKEEVHRRRLGLPSTSDSPIKEIAKEYLAWGKREGGKSGRAWATKWAENVERHLFGTPKIVGMLDRMAVARLDAITLHGFEKALGGWENAKTRGIVGGIIKAFLSWCEKRDILARNPLKFWPGRKMESGNKVRALTLEELDRLIKFAPANYAIAYDFGYYTGARDSEFDALHVEDARWDAGGVAIHWEGTKAKEGHLFKLPKAFMARLKEHCRNRHPKAPMFDLPKLHKARYFHRHREAAGIPYKTAEGKATFHSLRHTHETFLGAAATDSATELAIGRHTDMRTRKRYLHSFDAQKAETMERMASLRDGRNGDASSETGTGK